MILKKILSFTKSMLSSGTDASSKRAVGVGIAFVIVVVVFINIFTGKAPDPNVFGGLISLEVIAFGGVAVENVSSAIAQFKGGKDLPSCPPVPPTTTEDTSGGIPKANL
jgi:hypothetical protein